MRLSYSSYIGILIPGCRSIRLGGSQIRLNRWLVSISRSADVAVDTLGNRIPGLASRLVCSQYMVGSVVDALTSAAKNFFGSFIHPLKKVWLVRISR